MGMMLQLGQCASNLLGWASCVIWLSATIVYSSAFKPKMPEDPNKMRQEKKATKKAEKEAKKTNKG